MLLSSTSGRSEANSMSQHEHIIGYGSQYESGIRGNYVACTRSMDQLYLVPAPPKEEHGEMRRAA